jgi:hypothetical protein
VRPVRIGVLAREVLKDARDARQFQRARMGDHEIAGERGRAHTASASQPS